MSEQADSNIGDLVRRAGGELAHGDAVSRLAARGLADLGKLEVPWDSNKLSSLFTHLTRKHSVIRAGLALRQAGLTRYPNLATSRHPIDASEELVLQGLRRLVGRQQNDLTQVMARLDKMPSLEATVVQMRYGLGDEPAKSVEEIAASLRLSIGQVEEIRIAALTHLVEDLRLSQ
jgi:DNA-directed RNA polymerase specialized sigma24 family protein